MAERQSCELKALGSIPSGGLLTRVRQSTLASRSSACAGDGPPVRAGHGPWRLRRTCVFPSVLLGLGILLRWQRASTERAPQNAPPRRQGQGRLLYADHCRLLCFRRAPSLGPAARPLHEATKGPPDGCSLLPTPPRLESSVGRSRCPPCRTATGLMPEAGFVRNPAAELMMMWPL